MDSSEDSRQSQTDTITYWIRELKAGNPTARQELITNAYERLIRLTRRMKRDYPRLARWEETGDVFQQVSVRFYRALDSVDLSDSRHFFRLAALQIRRELINLAQRYQGPRGDVPDDVARNDSSGQVAEPADETRNPSQLAVWAEFHEAVNNLPDQQQEVFDLLFYQELSQQEAADLLGVGVRTVKRRWREAKMSLYTAVGGNLPSL